ncbi:outer membrane lipoprotein carrier protein LolA [Telmatospirillum sp. J64-1]|uniref:LolA family protein n=1 Tax=Telmatospirillum sp. J64-1 TaxID=2502183 RepID=UPI00115F3C4B|nr:outer membrane lipoprotein carrier protein LolA [Telmatospirillum sp. J64-1]
MSRFWRNWSCKAAALLVALAFVLPTASAEAARPAQLSAQDQADVARAENYLNSITTLAARFMQVAPDGSYAEGTAYLSRPGRLRMEYDPPTPILVVADGRFLIYHDKQLKQTSHVGLNQTPAGLLVRENIQFNGRDAMVTDVRREQGVLKISLVQRSDPSAGQITLIFSESPFALRQWEILDPQGQITTVSLFETRTGMPLDRRLFTFVDPNFLQQPWQQ